MPAKLPPGQRWPATVCSCGGLKPGACRIECSVFDNTSCSMSLLNTLFKKSPWRGWEPFPRKRCPVCKGEVLFRNCGGGTPKGGRWDGIETVCPTCGRNTIDDPLMPDNDHPEQKVTADAKGWTTCPCCGFRFTPSDQRAFRDGHHRRCGQALIIAE
jgi:hypothetical protein